MFLHIQCTSAGIYLIFVVRDCCGKKKKKKELKEKIFFYLLGSRGISFEDQTKHNKPTAQLCFTIVLFVNLFQNTQFYPYYPFKFLFFCNSYYSDFFPSQKSQLE